MRKLLTAGILILILAVTGCTVADDKPSYAENNNKKTLVVSVVKLPITLNPITSMATFDTMIYSQVSEPLLKYDPKTMEPVAGVAKNWEVKDGKTYTFHLNNNVYFSNNKRCTAYDFKYSYEKYLTPESTASYMLETILGSQDKLQGKTQETEGIKVLDDFTLEITLSNPNSNFLSALASPCLIVINNDEVEQLGSDFGKDTITGIGPFKILRNKPQEIILTPNDRYYGKKPYINELRFVELNTEETWQEYQRGKIDFTFFVPDVQLAYKKYRDNVELVSDLSTTYIAFNLQKEPMKSNVELRHAISLAINKEQLVNEVIKDSSGKAANSIVPPLLSGKNAKILPSYDIEKARQLLAEAGYPEGKGLPQLILTFHNRASQKAFVDKIKNALAAINISVKLIHADESLTVPYVKNVSDFNRERWAPDYLDVDSYVRPLFYSSGCANRYGYKNQQVDSLLDKAQSTIDFNERKNLLLAAEKLALNDFHLIPIYWSQYVTLKSDRVKNLQVSPNGYPLFEKVMIEE